MKLRQRIKPIVTKMLIKNIGENKRDEQVNVEMLIQKLKEGRGLQ